MIHHVATSPHEGSRVRLVTPGRIGEEPVVECQLFGKGVHFVLSKAEAEAVAAGIQRAADLAHWYQREMKAGRLIHQIDEELKGSR